ncbi:MAG: ribokinase [Tepidisphaerales bacterium]
MAGHDTPPTIVVVGSTNVDVILRLRHIPRPGETVTDGVLHEAFGGKGANTAVAAARTGRRTRTRFITALGDDASAEALLRSFAGDGIDTSAVKRVPGVRTGCALILVDAAGNNAIAVAPGANAALAPADLDAAGAVLASASMVVMQMEIPTATVRHVLARCAAASVPVLLNYAPVRDRSVEVDDQVHGLVVNETEAAQLTGLAVSDVPSARRAAEPLLARGPRFVVVTLGGAGAVVSAEGVSMHVPAFPVEVVDTTAAGDTFCGALAVALVEGQPLVDAVRFASAAAAVSVTRLGAQPSVPTRDEVEAMLARHPQR